MRVGVCLGACLTRRPANVGSGHDGKPLLEPRGAPTSRRRHSRCGGALVGGYEVSGSVELEVSEHGAYAVRLLQREEPGLPRQHALVHLAEQKQSEVCALVVVSQIVRTEQLQQLDEFLRPQVRQIALET
ncbi:uncharacterized protein BcabD6B2_57740 [Babesia caballi]|uniref:Uncharacterized protein n=1 Tax=Babesia caballi TaxID=5871 RepID=A0AAV4M298_BABCB|nr:hypothetical protein, conserved [Babesia caballi]